jgi:hypothetical protein
MSRSGAVPPAAFYCVSDDRYFLGAVGMINSLRLLGHAEPIFVLDCGLSAEQREMISPHATLVAAPREAPPWLLKTVAPLRHPAEVMVLIDADIVVTRPLGELIARAAEPCVVAIENDVDRHVPEWGELLDLGEVRRQPYVSSGLVFMGRSLGERVLGLMGELQERVNFDHTFWRANVPDYPFLYGDQDVFNAILASRVERGLLVALPNRLAPNPPFKGLRVLDERTLRVAHRDGTEPYAVHHFATKPWLEPTHHGVYSKLLRRLLTGTGVAMSVDEEELPLRMRSGLRAWVARKRVDAGETLYWHVREPLESKLRAMRG